MKVPPIGEKKTIALVAGTRPEVIKMAPVYFALQESETLRPVILSTAQHRQMLDQAFAAFGITPEFDLDLMRPGQDLTGLTARVLEAVGDFTDDICIFLGRRRWLIAARIGNSKPAT